MQRANTHTKEKTEIIKIGIKEKGLLVGLNKSDKDEHSNINTIHNITTYNIQNKYRQKRQNQRNEFPIV